MRVDRRFGGVVGWLLGMIVLLAIIGGGVAWWYLASPSRVTSYLKVRRQPSSQLMDAPRISNEEYRQRKNGYAALLKSPLVLDATLQRREIADLDLVQRQRDPLAWLSASLQVGFPDDGDVMTVTLPSSRSDSEDAIRLVDAVTSAFQDKVLLQGRLEQATAESDFRAALADLDKQLIAELEQLQKLKESNAAEDKVRVTMLEADCESKLELRRELKLKALRIQFQNDIAQRMEQSGGVSDADKVVIMQKATWIDR